ncbi:hypothetical protein F2Q68_00043606 [Brassica cretica]|uniref:non-specific serine/threonine protein kinase n=1 Tax=Brassica cretica TaxID=69181 RepID=A0A8S9LM58_BRACR|nr:hypothetical protein F2Q68_00043606 [Brassica cretica]
MKFLFWFLPFLIIAFDILELVQAQDQTGFISLDCGLVPTETNYVEKSTNISYKSDFNYIETGEAKKINDAYRTLFQQQTWSLRSFPHGQRNCYNFNLTANRKYLIRGTFIYGNYDNLNQLPIFDLHIGPNRWTTVTTLGVTNGSIHEMIHVLTQDRLQVCLVKTGDTKPFISSLELRPLNNETYVTQSGSLVAVSRVFFSPTPTFVRYDEDINDRTWVPYIDKNNSVIRTDVAVDTSNFYNVPQVVARTAAIPVDESQPLTIDWTLDEVTAQSYIYMHFAEIQNLKANETREFNITYNGGKRWFDYFRPPNFSITTIFNPRAVSSPDGKFNFTFSMTSNSTLPPLINALEIYKVLDLSLLETNQDEVLAMMNIKVTYELNKRPSWQGDPCVPQSYRWEGLDCSYPDSEPPRIISLNLTGSNLTGTITSDISKLTQLRELDLSNNGLSGEIPAFFADMSLLTLINLSGNPEINGSVIPDSLQKRIDRNSLKLILDGNQNPTTKSKSKDVPVVAIAASVAGGFSLIVIVAIIFVLTRRKQKPPEASGQVSVTTGTANTETRSPNPSIITKERKFTYSEVLKMTNNFARVLGKGGFGTVYHGNLDDTEVAVKMLSHSSAQGYKEFKAEVELLLRVHHRHLVGLVGYCDDGDKLALIYEYMANGDLRENMLGKRSGNVLSWETRMQIAVEAAQGGFGTVYHGNLDDTEVAVKMLSHSSAQGYKEFKAEVELLLRVHHRHLVGLVGYCDDGDKLALIYEYMANGDLRENMLLGKRSGNVLSWETRMQIAVEAAQGLEYLHNGCRPPMVHRDVKTTNILLNERFQAKLADFGLSRSFPIDGESHVMTVVAGTPGYLDPESIIDPKLMDDYDANGVWKVIELALACVNPSSNRRPTMPHVVMELNECLAFEVERKNGADGLPQKVLAFVMYNVNNTVLHVAGALSPSDELTKVSGAALKMQREIQWYKEVKSLVPVVTASLYNLEVVTPRQVFEKAHEPLRKEAEEWMKYTASACSFVAALIATVTFQAIFTVPGGTDESSGDPLHLTDSRFMIFTVADTLSFFSSCTSVVIFLTILTSRYSFDDFLISLPRKMILGLSIMFFSIAAMLVAFSTALFTMLRKMPLLVIPVLPLACLPAALFVLLQYPLLGEMISSTYGNRLFKRDTKPWF